VLESRPITETSILNRIGKGAVDITDPALSVRALGRSWRCVECGAAVDFWGRPFLGNGKATTTVPCASRAERSGMRALAWVVVPASA
jgi:hypothetical protein